MRTLSPVSKSNQSTKHKHTHKPPYTHTYIVYTLPSANLTLSENCTRKSHEADDILHFSYYQQIPWKDKNQQWICPTTKYCLSIKAWYIFFFCAKELHCYPKSIKIHQWATLLHWVTCSFITMNTHTVVYFDSIPHTPSCFPKYSLEHQTWINSLLKIVPYKCTMLFWYRNVCGKTAAVSGNNLLIKNMKVYICGPFFKISV